MGINSSKPGDGPHVWAQSTGSLAKDLEALKSGSETDVSRAKKVEVKLQSLVTAELQRLRSEADAAAREAAPRLLAVPDGSEPDAKSSIDRHAVASEVEQLRTRLEGQRARMEREVPSTVETTRSELVRCLRDHDRRPLDCWREVEAFKLEVGKLEREWVEKAA